MQIATRVEAVMLGLRAAEQPQGTATQMQGRGYPPEAGDRLFVSREGGRDPAKAKARTHSSRQSL